AASVLETRGKKPAVPETVKETVGKLARVFKRHAQGGMVNPDSHDGTPMPLQGRLIKTVQSGKSVRTVMFWGAGEKQAPDDAEEELLKRTMSLTDDLVAHYPKGVAVDIVFAD